MRVHERVQRHLTQRLRRARHLYLDRFVFVHINKTGGSSVEAALRLPLDHSTAQEKIAELGRDEWDRRFSFTVVRNPWDKVVSHYFYRVQTNQTGLGEHPLPFSEWVQRAYLDHDPAYYDQPRMFMPQLAWLRDAQGQMAVDDVCRFEALADDVARATSQFGPPVLLPHVKRSVGRGPYSDQYDDASRRIVEAVFQEDIDYFQYTF